MKPIAFPVLAVAMVLMGGCQPWLIRGADRAVVGAPGDYHVGGDSGSACVFRRDDNSTPGIGLRVHSSNVSFTRS